MDHLLSNQNVFRPVGVTEHEGLLVGSTLDVPPGFFGVTTCDGQAVYHLQPGTYEVTQAQFPAIKPRFKYSKSAPVALDAILYLIRAEAVMLPWLLRVSLDGPNKLTCYEIRGSLTIRVTDPLKFAQAAYTQAHAEGKKRASRDRRMFSDRNTDAKRFAIGTIAQFGDDLGPLIARTTLLTTVQNANLTPDKVRTSLIELQNAAGPELNRMLGARGVELQYFTVEGIAGPVPLECQLCGSVGDPIAQALFMRNISVFYVRFESRVSGTCCRSCALQYGLGYTGAMFVCGWWGLVGALVTPFYIIMNIYNLAKVLIMARCDAPMDLTSGVTPEQYRGFEVKPPTRFRTKDDKIRIGIIASVVIVCTTILVAWLMHTS